MNASLYNFLNGLIDYAGLFPPAGLDLETAVRKYAGYRKSSSGWMLGRFLIPATRLDQLAADADFRYSIIVSPEVSAEEREQLGQFTGNVEMVETRLLPTATGSADAYTNQLLTLQAALQGTGLQGAQLFAEAAEAEPAASAIAAFNRGRTDQDVISSAGFKLRCGGLEKTEVPTVEQVASILHACCTKGIPVKFTAGLHQPLCKYSPELGVRQHGFINIFAAALLSCTTVLGFGEIARCLQDENPADFVFSDETFSWQDRSISAADISALRAKRIPGYGSCSFDEPLEGLHALGLLGS